MSRPSDIMVTSGAVHDTGRRLWLSAADRRAIRQRCALAAELKLHSVSVLGSVWTLHHPRERHTQPRPESARQGTGTGATSHTAVAQHAEVACARRRTRGADADGAGIPRKKHPHLVEPGGGLREACDAAVDLAARVAVAATATATATAIDAIPSVSCDRFVPGSHDGVCSTAVLLLSGVEHDARSLDSREQLHETRARLLM